MKLSLLALNSDRTVLGFFYDRESGSEPSTYDRAIKLNLHRSIMISSFLTYRYNFSEEGLRETYCHQI